MEINAENAWRWPSEHENLRFSEIIIWNKRYKYLNSELANFAKNLIVQWLWLDLGTEKEKP
jgi:hypothetical protein